MVRPELSRDRAMSPLALARLPDRLRVTGHRTSRYISQ